MRKFILQIVIGLLLVIFHAHAKEKNIKIAFSAEHGGGLYVLDVTSKKFQPIDVGMLNVGKLDYNRNKNFLVFESSKQHGSPRGLYVFDMKQKVKRNIYAAKSFEDNTYRPKFFPTGEFVFALNYTKGILRYEFKNNTWEKIEVKNTNDSFFQGISFSETGKKVAISPAKFNGFLIAEVNNKEFIIKNHILTDFKSCVSPHWVNDETIIFAGRKEAGLQYIWKVSLKTGQLQQLTKTPIGTRDNIDLSTDRKVIVFTGTSKPVKWRLWKVNIDGSGLEQLTKGGTLSSHLSPVWLD